VDVREDGDAILDTAGFPVPFGEITYV